jgi:hypothetical protein
VSGKGVFVGDSLIECGYTKVKGDCCLLPMTHATSLFVGQVLRTTKKICGSTLWTVWFPEKSNHVKQSNDAKLMAANGSNISGRNQARVNFSVGVVKVSGIYQLPIRSKILFVCSL